MPLTHHAWLSQCSLLVTTAVLRFTRAHSCVQRIHPSAPTRTRVTDLDWSESRRNTRVTLRRPCRLGEGITTSLLGKPVLDEGIPFHTGVLGHLGTTASAELMSACDTLLLVGTNGPWTEFYPAPG
jgi:hypothetical protein